MSSDRNDDEMICALTTEEHEALRNGLNELPDAMPSRELWQRIREQAEAEGLVSSPGRSWRWYSGVGVAAAALLAAVILPGLRTTDTAGVTVPEMTVSRQPEHAETNLTALRATSRQIERDLRALPDGPRVARAGTVATIAEIEDRIAAIDYQLSEASESMTLEEREVYWIERVRLMKVLLQLRYAQAQRAAVR